MEKTLIRGKAPCQREEAVSRTAVGSDAQRTWVEAGGGGAHSRVKLAAVGGLRLSQLSALSLLEISSSELETDEPTSTSSNFLLRLEPVNASIGFKGVSLGSPPRWPQRPCSPPVSQAH